MKQTKILTNFLRLTDSKFQTKSEAIQVAMTGNANFPSPVPTIADLTTAINLYSVALSAAESKDKTKIAIKNDMRTSLETALVNLAASVTATAAGSRSMLVSSGFDVSSDVKNPRVLGGVENFQVLAGASPGEVISSVNSVLNGNGYIYQYTPDPLAADSNWVSLYSSSCSAAITGLQALKKYWFRIIITGSRNQSVQTDAISKTVV
jgi:hypothetical protein